MTEITKTIGFVAPWYGEAIGGGAEAELRGVVHHLKDAGVPLEVLTTCVKSFQSDWNEDFHTPGLTEEAGIPVRRFPVRKRDTRAFDRVNAKLMAGEALTAAEEETFCREMVNSTALEEYLRDRGEDYGMFFFIPYMFGTTYHGCQACPEKSVLIPCFHEEPYAYLKLFREAFSRVAGMIFNADPEKELAERLFGVEGERFTTFGIGLDADWTGDAARFRRKYGLEDPFILYAGRKEAGKRVDLLMEGFLRYKRRYGGNLKLVLIGGGKMEIPDPEEIIDLGFVPLQDKYDAYRAAALFCNPSEMESFSLVIMESWLAERPVLVNGKCPVTKDFCMQAGGGLYFNGEEEFVACVRWLLAHPEESDRMGRSGRAYVKRHFAWDVIVRRYLEYIRDFTGKVGV